MDTSAFSEQLFNDFTPPDGSISGTIPEDLRKSTLQPDSTWSREMPFAAPLHRIQSITGGGGQEERGCQTFLLKAHPLLPGSLSQRKERRTESCSFSFPSE